MMPTIPAARAEGEGVPPSYSRYRYDVTHPNYQRREGEGRRCFHHIQGTGMMSTFPTTSVEVEREEVLPS
jgi:hypothetical protein